MGSLVDKVKRLVTIVLLIVAVVLIAYALIYWGSPDLSESALADYAITESISSMSPGLAIVLAGVLIYTAYAIDPETASRVTKAATGLAKDVGDFVTEAVKSTMSPFILPALLCAGAYLIFSE